MAIYVSFLLNSHIFKGSLLVIWKTIRNFASENFSQVMSNKEFSEKLKAGIELAGKRMLEEKALRNEDVIVSSDGKTIERIPARQLL